MRAFSHSADRIPERISERLSTCVLLLGGSVSGILLSMVALPLAFSSPFPALGKGSAWVIDAPPRSSLAVAAVDSTPAESQAEGRMMLASLGASDEPQLTFAERWNQRVPQAAMTDPADEPDDVEVLEPPSLVPPAAPQVMPDERKPSEKPSAAPAAKAPAPKHAESEDPVVQYLWEVYQRRPVKTDSSGDFTWKDRAAAKRLGMSLRSYVIGGMDPDFREQLYHAGRAMDAGGLRWSMLSAFRDDYRQGLASGFKAHGGNSLHGGSRATGGYGHGRAIDITCAEGDDAEPIWHWIDAHGAKFGLLRPMTRIDPAHIQARASYHDIGRELREARLKLEHKLNGPAAAALGKTKVASARVEK